MQESLIAKKAKFYVIDATKVARDSGMGGRINTIMQVCFFALSGVLPRDKAIEAIKYSIKKTYGKKGEEVVAMNLKAVDNTLEHLHEVPVTQRVNGSGDLLPPISPNAPTVREGRAGPAHRRRGRRPARERVPGGRHVPDRHGAIRKTQSRARHPGLGRKNLHPMPEMRGDLPARDHPREGL